MRGACAVCGTVHVWARPHLRALLHIEVGDYTARNGDGVVIILGEVVGDAGLLAVQGRPTQLLGGHHFPGGS